MGGALALLARRPRPLGALPALTSGSSLASLASHAESDVGSLSDSGSPPVGSLRHAATPFSHPFAPARPPSRAAGSVTEAVVLHPRRRPGSGLSLAGSETDGGSTNAAGHRRHPSLDDPYVLQRPGTPTGAHLVPAFGSAVTGSAARPALASPPTPYSALGYATTPGGVHLHSDAARRVAVPPFNLMPKPPRLCSVLNVGCPVMRAQPVTPTASQDTMGMWLYGAVTAAAASLTGIPAPLPPMLRAG